MPFAQYNELLTSLADWLVRDDLVSQIPDFVRMAEMKIQRQIKLRMNEKETTGNFVADQDYINVPSDFLDSRNFTILTSPTRVLEIVSADKLEDVRENGSPGVTIAGYIRGTTLELGPTPTATDGYEWVYMAGITALAEGNQTNWLLTNAGDILHQGAILQAQPYLQNDERIPILKALYDEGVEELKRQEWRARTGGGVLRIRPDTFA